MPENLGLRKFSRFYTLWAMTCRWIFCSIAAIHFPQRSEAAIGLRVINF
jgi:hypothetical protein